MATSMYPATSESIRGGLGVLDFYQWKGINCIRLWPRNPRQPGTPEQLATINNFRAARTAPAARSPEARTLTNLLPLRPHGTRVGYQTTIALRSVIAQQTFDALYPHKIAAPHVEPDGRTTVVLHYKTSLVPRPALTRFAFEDVADTPSQVEWTEMTTPGTAGNAPTSYHVFPDPLPDRLLLDVVVDQVGGTVHLGIPSRYTPVTLLAYYTVAGGRDWLTWRMPLAYWTLGV